MSHPSIQARAVSKAGAIATSRDDRRQSTVCRNSSFDELMEELDRQLPELLTGLHSDLSSASAGSDRESATNDLQSAETPIDTLDHSLLRSKLIAYCEAVRLPKPDLTSIDSLLRAMADRNLVIRNVAGWTPTRGGQLLFVKHSKDQLPRGNPHQPLSLIDVAPTSGMVSVFRQHFFWKLIVVKAAMWRRLYMCAQSLHGHVMRSMS